LVGGAASGAWGARGRAGGLPRSRRLVLPGGGGVLSGVLRGVGGTGPVGLSRKNPASAAPPASTQPVPANASTAAGAKVFGAAGCGSCHTLAAAHAGGQVGPNLDSARPDYGTVLDKVTNGGGGRPALSGPLSAQQPR